MNVDMALLLIFLWKDTHLGFSTFGLFLCVLYVCVCVCLCFGRFKYVFLFGVLEMELMGYRVYVCVCLTFSRYWETVPQFVLALAMLRVALAPYLC